MLQPGPPACQPSLCILVGQLPTLWSPPASSPISACLECRRKDLGKIEIGVDLHLSLRALPASSPDPPPAQALSPIDLLLHTCLISACAFQRAPWTQLELMGVPQTAQCLLPGGQGSEVRGSSPHLPRLSGCKQELRGLVSAALASTFHKRRSIFS